MKFKCVQYKAYGVRFLGLFAFLLFLSCGNIIEKSASDYFPYEEGNWWRYFGDSETLFVEVEPLDTLLQTECFPVTYSGVVKYLVENDRAIDEYVKILYDFSGNDYTIIEDFITRIELPLVYGNTYQDSLIDSLNIFGQWVKAKYHISGVVSEYEYNDSVYTGDVYKIELVTVYHLFSQDTTIIDTTNVEEYYAPDIGMVRLRNGDGDYYLTAYELQ